MLIHRLSAGVEVERKDMMPGCCQSRCHGLEISLPIQRERRTFERCIIGRQVEFGRMHRVPTRSQCPKAVFDEAQAIIQRSEMLKCTR